MHAHRVDRRMHRWRRCWCNSAAPDVAGVVEATGGGVGVTIPAVAARVPKERAFPPLSAVWTENTGLAHRSQLRIRNTSLGALSYYGTSVPDERFWLDGITFVNAHLPVLAMCFVQVKFNNREPFRWPVESQKAAAQMETLRNAIRGAYKSKNSEIRCYKSWLKPQSRHLSQQYDFCAGEYLNSAP